VPVDVLPDLHEHVAEHLVGLGRVVEDAPGQAEDPWGELIV